MKIELQISELQEFLSNFYDVKIDLQNIEEDKIKVHYFVSIVLTIKEVKQNIVYFGYELNGLVNLLEKAAHAILEKKLANFPIEWNSNTKEVNIDLTKIHELDGFLKLFYLSELQFVNNNIFIEVCGKNPQTN